MSGVARTRDTDVHSTRYTACPRVMGGDVLVPRWRTMRWRARPLPASQYIAMAVSFASSLQS